MDDGLDYDVTTMVKFRLDFDGNGEMNLLALPDVQRAFASHVQKVFQANDTLRDYVTSDLDFSFDGRHCGLKYTFSCFDENEAEAESFSQYCVRKVQKELESFGCKLLDINCTTEEADMTWLDQLEDAIFGLRQDSTKEEQDSVNGPYQEMGGMAL